MKVGHEKPVNKTAALVVAKGESFSFQPNECHQISDVPFPTQPARTDDPNFIDLTGRVFGRLTVIGYGALGNRRWVCRCTCGMYVMRSSKAVKAGTGAMCEHCKLLQLAKRRDLQRRTGKFVNMEDFKG